MPSYRKRPETLPARTTRPEVNVMALTRRRVLQLASSAAALATAPQFAWADAYPSRPIKLTVFVPAGGGPDIVARLFADRLAPRLGQPIVVEDRPGYAGGRALDAVVHAAPDGYTLLLAGTPHFISATMHEGSDASSIRDIEPVIALTRSTFVMVVNPKLPAKTLPEFLAYAKAHPGKINMGSNGAGNLAHLSGELFKMLAGVDLLHVPFRGSPAAQAALIAGDVHVMFELDDYVAPERQGRQAARAWRNEYETPR